MKKQLLIIVFSFAIGTVYAQSTRTSIANGNASNPLTWDCTCIPFPGDSIIINHNIILDFDFGYSTGAMIINASGSLTGSTATRGFATLGPGRFENHGTFDVARVVHLGGTAHNTGIYSADSLITSISAEGGFTNTGDMQIAVDYLNTGDLDIGAAGLLVVQGDFLHGDTVSPGMVLLTCDGGMRVNGDFGNADSINGSGQLCIYGNSVNWGIIFGTLDMCDVTPGGQNVDLNLGTFAFSVQTCVAACNIGLNEITKIPIQVYPNPATNFIQIKAEQEIDIVIYDMMGKKVYQSTIPGQLQNITLSEWAAGVYLYCLYSENATTAGKFIKQ